jgi:acetyl-CoA acetyltransferase
MVDMLGELMTPAAHFALLAERYLAQTGGTPADLAHVSVKNHRNGLLNDNAQRRESLSLEMVLASAAIAGPLTKYQCCPIGEGAAAVIVASEAAIARLRLDRHRAVRIAASVSMSEELYEPDVFPDAELTRRATERALQQAGLTAEELDVVEVHDAFSIEELMYVEAIGLSKPGSAISDLKRGDFDIGGRCAVSASGGLQSMGHPVGPTGVAQLVEIATQLRGEAGPRQQPGARVGLAHMLGLGAVCIEHVLVSGNSSAVDEPDDDTTGHLP